MRDPEVIRQEIEQTRHELGEAVEELAAKTNVKTRARAKAAELRHSAAAIPEWARGHPAAAVAAAAAAAAALVVAVLVPLRR